MAPTRDEFDCTRHGPMAQRDPSRKRVADMISQMTEREPLYRGTADNGTNFGAPVWQHVTENGIGLRVRPAGSVGFVDSILPERIGEIFESGAGKRQSKLTFPVARFSFEDETAISLNLWKKGATPKHEAQGKWVRFQDGLKRPFNYAFLNSHLDLRSGLCARLRKEPFPPSSHHVDGVSHLLQASLQELGMPEIVGIELHNVFAPGIAKKLIVLPADIQSLIVLTYKNPLVVSESLSEEWDGVVARTIVANNDFQVLERLREDAANSAADPRHSIVDWNTDGNHRAPFGFGEVLQFPIFRDWTIVGWLSPTIFTIM